MVLSAATSPRVPSDYNIVETSRLTSDQSKIHRLTLRWATLSVGLEYVAIFGELFELTVSFFDLGNQICVDVLGQYKLQSLVLPFR